ncbi:hypothetical protein C6502_07555 [Candidatus Poribacteria bacterium]|nr:MAG: hypothetical protein C6502_07555 [Candidatus Poribacteria bacterium]
MTNTIDAVKVGRVFFTPDSGPDIEAVTVLTLESHVGNVVKLVEKFRRDFYPTFKWHNQETHDLLIRAAQKHDEAKPETFRVTYQGWKGADPKSLGYSFAGHRFRVFDPNLYVELLIRLHHEFSVEGIVKAQFQLSHSGFSKEKVESFLLDLYILEMCDQIEAEIETYAFTGNVQPRVFMDFHSRMLQDEKVEVTPYPFGNEDENEEIVLPLTYYQFEVSEEDRWHITKTLTGNSPQEGLNHLREMIVKAHTYTKCQRKDMILCKAY